MPERHGVEAVHPGRLVPLLQRPDAKLIDCCSTSRARINGDASLVGYCYRGRRVFCVIYYDTGVPC